MALTLAQLADCCGGGEISGSGEVLISGVASLTAAAGEQLAFFSGGRTAALASTRAAAVVMRAGDAAAAALPAGTACWRVDGEPRLYFGRAIEALYPPETAAFSGIAPTAAIAADARLGDGVAVAPTATIGAGAVVGTGSMIYPGAVVSAGAVIGAGCILHPRVVLYPRVVLGQRCVLHAGAVIGADGFGYTADGGAASKLRQLGSVRIGDDVEIGANSTIDCGALDDTLIGSGVKIDNLVQIGHNVVIGEHTIICGTVGIAGSTTIGKRCVIGGAAGIAGHLVIGDEVKIAGATAVTRDIEAGETVSSVIPAMPVRAWRRFVAGLRRQTK